MADAGRLTGPELHVGGQRLPGRRPDRHPGPLGRTASWSPPSGAPSPPSTPTAGRLVARMDDGRTHTLGPDRLGADRLALGYATTVHRSQGATFDTAHLFADGGGRELGYVGMSRARQNHPRARRRRQRRPGRRGPRLGLEPGAPPNLGHRHRHPRQPRTAIRSRSKPTSKLPRSCEPSSAGLASKPNEPPWRPSAADGADATLRRQASQPRPAHPTPRPAPRTLEESLPGTRSRLPSRRANRRSRPQAQPVALHSRDNCLVGDAHRRNLGVSRYGTLRACPS